MDPKAFPNSSVYDKDGNKNHEGMDLRDYFAAQAMQGFFSNTLPTKEQIQDANCKTCAEFIAFASYKYADAMMEARKK